MTSDDQAKAMNVNDIVFSTSGEGKITHAIIGGAIFFADDTTREVVNDAIRIEREACAKLVESFKWPDAHDFASHAAAAIRARA